FYRGPLHEMLEITKITLNTDIDNLINRIPDYIHLEYDAHELKLNCDAGYLVQDFLLEVARDNVMYNLFKNILYNKKFKLTEIAEIYFVSEGSIRSRIEHYNQILARFDLKLSFYEVDLIGNESNKRYFFNILFTEFRQFFMAHLDPDTEENEKLLQEMRKILSEKQKQLLSTTYYKLARWLSIARIRISNQQYVQISADKVEAISKEIEFAKFEQTYRLIENNLIENTVLPLEEIVWAYVTILDTVDYSGESKNRSMHRDRPFDETDGIFYRMIQETAKSLQMSGYGDFHFSVFSYLKNIRDLTELSPIYQLATDALVSYTFQENIDIFELWKQKILEYKDQLSFEIKFIDGIVTHLTLITSRFVYFSRTNKKVVCSFSGETGLSNLLETKLTDYLGDLVELIFISTHEITDKLLVRYRADMIISNYPIRNCAILNYRIPYIPQSKDYEELRKHIYDEVKENTSRSKGIQQHY
ncbi:helix-turn-helix domain-containing protein, partial [Enterococcus hermanniensis]